ncbi:MAG: hypothetical protein FJ320_10410 [SAR202 cluster bacterium]|nr:hypothetical protein [SAR202 cluster bacterium]
MKIKLLIIALIAAFAALAVACGDDDENPGLFDGTPTPTRTLPGGSGNTPPGFGPIGSPTP